MAIALIELDGAQQEAPIDETSTIRVAKEFFRASWKHNPGRRVDDIPLFDSLPPESQFHLLECASAAERLLDEYGNENEELVRYNTAVVLYDAYHKHPASSLPELPWDTAPTDVKTLWMAYATDVLSAYYQFKQLPRHKPWIEIKVKKL